MTKVRVAEGFNPYVYIDRDAFDDMLCIARATNREIAWFAQVHDEGDGVFLIDNVFLPKQQSSGSTVEIEPAHLADMAEEYISLHGPEAFNRLHCWGHSHHTMGVTPSTQDQKTVDALCAAIKKTFIALRVNHAGQVQADVAYPSGITVEDANVYIGWIPREKEEAWSTQVKERLEFIKYRAAKPVGKAAGATTPGAFGSTSSSPWWNGIDDDELVVGAPARTETQAMLTEATTRIHRFPHETPDDYLTRVEAMEGFFEKDMKGFFGGDDDD